mmetsp:Transcript_169479/g.412024  ORF Transcript_169479/g.412024 Transcript_169479/m.412024 type:complete len:377 (-) Transcript_169479:677-1807(-)
MATTPPGLSGFWPIGADRRRRTEGETASAAAGYVRRLSRRVQKLETAKVEGEAMIASLRLLLDRTPYTKTKRKKKKDQRRQTKTESSHRRDARPDRARATSTTGTQTSVSMNTVVHATFSDNDNDDDDDEGGSVQSPASSPPSSEAEADCEDPLLFEKVDDDNNCAYESKLDKSLAEIIDDERRATSRSSPFGRALPQGEHRSGTSEKGARLLEAAPPQQPLRHELTRGTSEKGEGFLETAPPPRFQPAANLSGSSEKGVRLLEAAPPKRQQLHSPRAQSRGTSEKGAGLLETAPPHRRRGDGSRSPRASTRRRRSVDDTRQPTPPWRRQTSQLLRPAHQDQQRQGPASQLKAKGQGKGRTRQNPPRVGHPHRPAA